MQDCPCAKAAIRYFTPNKILEEYLYVSLYWSSLEAEPSSWPLLSGTGKELARRPYAPGDHGANNRRKISEYGQQLREKQKLRWMYGSNERQFQNLFLRAGKIKEGTHGDNFMILLETRLDNLVFRLGLASSRPQARQLVNHGHITVDGKRVDIPSMK